MWALLQKAVLIIYRLLSPAPMGIALWEVVNLSPVFEGGLAVKYLTLSLQRHILISLIVMFDDSNAEWIAE